MNGVDPKWVFYLGILVTIETAIGQGSVKLINVVPEAWAPFVVGWCTLLGFIGNVVMTALAGVSSKQAGPLIKPAAVVAIAVIGLFAFAGDAHAQLRKPQVTGDVVADAKANLGIAHPAARLTGSPVNDLLGALDAKLLPDLQYAQKLASASGSKVTAPCYQAWIDIILTRQKALTDEQGNALPLPDPHLVSDFEKMVELRNALQPDSDFMLKCSPVASMVKKDIIGFIGVVISGGAGLATLVPGL